MVEKECELAAGECTRYAARPSTLTREAVIATSNSYEMLPGALTGRGFTNQFCALYIFETAL